MAITPEIPKGRFVTFYSTEGGVGRSLAAYNMAALLAASGERTLLIDLDFDKPRLTPELAPNSKGGVLDIFYSLMGDSDLLYEDGAIQGLLKGKRYLKHLRLPSSLTSANSGSRHSFDFLPVTTANCESYLGRLDQFQSDIDSFGVVSDELAIRMRRDLTAYDYILVDSPSGFSNITYFTINELSNMVVAFTRPGKGNQIGFKTFLEKISLCLPQQEQQEKSAMHLVSVISLVPEVEAQEFNQVRQGMKRLINKALPTVIDQERQPLELHFDPHLLYGDFPIVRAVLPESGLDLDYIKLCQTIRSRFDSEMTH